jgi:hypothetical protein
MERYSDVLALIAESKEQYMEVKKLYDKSLRDKSLDIRIKVKNLMENLRSILDYSSHDIYEDVCKPNRQKLNKPDPHKIYFPHGRNENDFEKCIAAFLPSLQVVDPSIYSLIRNVQPFVSGSSWICDLCDINNENKHDKLTPQTREEIETYTVEGAQGSVSILLNNPNVTIASQPGAVKIFGVPAQFTSEGIKTAPSNLRHKRTVWVSFIFEGTSINVLNLLNSAVPGCESLATLIYKNLKLTNSNTSREKGF